MKVLQDNPVSVVWTISRRIYIYFFFNTPQRTPKQEDVKNSEDTDAYNWQLCCGYKNNFIKYALSVKRTIALTYYIGHVL